MKLLDRYILREVSLYAAISLGVFLFILMTPEVLKLSALLARENISLPQVGQVFLAVLPPKLLWALPLGVLAGLLIGLSRAAADNELIALRSAGVGPRRILLPVMLFAALGAAATLLTSAWWIPQSARTLRAMQAALQAGQASYEVRPRVFDEHFPDHILYVQNTLEGGARWQGIFLAHLADPRRPRLTVAESGVVIPDPQRRQLHLHLRNGSTHTYAPERPDRYSVSTFAESLLVIPLPETGADLPVRASRELSLAELWFAGGEVPGGRAARADFHRRLALPAACLVFGLLALPLGLMAERTGRAAGFVTAVGAALGYYFIFLLGDRMARGGDFPPGLGVWLGNVVFLLPAVYYYARKMEKPGFDWTGPATLLESWRAAWRSRKPAPATAQSGAPNGFPSLVGTRLPRTLDLYVVRGVLFYFLVLLLALLLLFGLFTILEMMDEIAAQGASWELVARFLWSLLPQATYLMAPLALLLGVLVELSLLSKRNELVAIKGAGISLYRVAVPVVLVGLLCSSLLFWLDSSYLPQANQQQEILRNQIKGRPPQTFFQADRRWIFGQQPRIYHYSFFDPTQDVLARLNVLELNPDTFALERRLFAQRAHWDTHLQAWVLEDGWERLLREHQTLTYQRFTVASYTELTEPPAYFRREVRESAQMNWRELGRYIDELQQGGFGVTQLTVQWHKKFSFPLIAAVIVLVGIPFGVTMGHRGAVGGVALGIATGFLYWGLSGFFEALGTLSLLPPFLGAWGPNLIFLFGGLYLFLNIDT